MQEHKMSRDISRGAVLFTTHHATDGHLEAINKLQGIVNDIKHKNITHR
jgi:hypothetical protein